MNVCTPHELYRTPRLPQAAVSLCVSVESVVEKVLRLEKELQLESVVKNENALEIFFLLFW